jgi:putative membrane protein
LTLLLGSALAAPWMPWSEPVLFFAVQLAFGGLGVAAALWVPGFRRVFVTEERASETAEEQAFQEFYRHGLQRTAGETGVLLFVSLFERRVIVLGDRGIDEKLNARHWEQVDQAVLAGIRAGDLPAGLSRALTECGEVLAQHFPATGANPNEVFDHVMVRRE